MSQNDPLNRKRVLIVGFGRQGQALARWLPTVGASVVVNDSRGESTLGINRRDYPGVRFVLGGHPEKVLNNIDVVCVSGGVPLSLELIRNAIKQELPITNDVQLFMERCPAPVIGITGSAGKTTTTSLVGDIVQRAGYKTWIGGNIGNVLIESLDEITRDDCVVLELSSFQLEVMKTSPNVAAILNITPNHLDRHKTMENYINAKANILRRQTTQDIAVLSADDANTRALELAVKGELVQFSSRTMVPNGTFMVGKRITLAGAASYDYVPHILGEKDDIPLRGDHNVLNVLAACAIVGSLGLAIDRPGIEPEVMHEAIKNFKPVPHRLETVRKVNDVIYINDSIASAPERLVAALHSFDETLVVLLGGADKDLPWEQVIHLVLQKARHVILFGKPGRKQVADKTLPMFRLMGANERTVTRVNTLDEAVEKAAKIAQAGDVVLLSPGGTSYDAYNNFEERGEHFRDLVNALDEATDA